MQRRLLPLSLLLILAAVPAFTQTSFQSFPSDPEAGTPTYLNAEVVRVDRADARVTLRSESGDVVLTADSRALGMLSALRSGAKVLVAYETVLDETGRSRRIVTYARTASPTSGEPERVLMTTPVTVEPSRARTRTSGAVTSTVVQAGLSGTTAVMAASNVQPLPPGFVQQGPNTFTTSGTTASAPTGGTLTSFGATGLPFTGGVAVPSVAPGSPYASNVPSIPAPDPTVAAVLPPAAAKAPLSNEEVGTMRALGERDLDAAAVVLAVAANDIDGQWLRFKTVCLPGFVASSATGREWFLALDGRVPTSSDDQCRAAQASLLATARSWDAQLGIALDAARRADVLASRTRETLERHRIGR